MDADRLRLLKSRLAGTQAVLRLLQRILGCRMTPDQLSHPGPGHNIRYEA